MPQLLQTALIGAGAGAGLGFATGFGAGVATGDAAATGADAAGAISTTGAGAAAVSLAFSSKQPLNVNKLVSANVVNRILRVDDFKMLSLKSWCDMLVITFNRPIFRPSNQYLKCSLTEKNPARIIPLA